MFKLIENLFYAAYYYIHKFNNWWYSDSKITKTVGHHHCDIHKIIDDYQLLKQKSIYDHLNIDSLNKIIEIDPHQKIAIVEPLCSMYNLIIHIQKNYKMSPLLDGLMDHHVLDDFKNITIRHMIENNNTDLIKFDQKLIENMIEFVDVLDYNGDIIRLNRESCCSQFRKTIYNINSNTFITSIGIRISQL
jgi:hypothetical protein